MADYVRDAVQRGIRFADESGEGVWRTISGSPVFIKEGQSVGEAVAAKFGKKASGAPRAQRFKVGTKVKGESTGLFIASKGEYKADANVQGNTLYLGHFGVAPELRRKGVGSSMVKSIVEKALELKPGLSTIRGSVVSKEGYYMIKKFDGKFYEPEGNYDVITDEDRIISYLEDSKQRVSYSVPVAQFKGKK